MKREKTKQQKKNKKKNNKKKKKQKQTKNQKKKKKKPLHNEIMVVNLKIRFHAIHLFLLLLVHVFLF